MSGTEQKISDEMVEAYDRAYDAATEYFGADEMEVGNPVGIRAGLAAVVPLILAQVADDAQRHYEEIVAEAWDAAAELLSKAEKSARQLGISQDYAEGLADAASTLAETVAKMRARRQATAPEQST